MKTFFSKILGLLTRLALMKFKPVVVGITGSVGKTSAKQAVSAVLGERFQVRVSSGNYNNEFGVPFAVFGSASPGRNPWAWVWFFIRALRTLLGSRYPQVLVLEMGADRAGDIAYLLKITGPINYAVITDIGISHLSNYPNQDALSKEKLSLLKGLKPNGTAVLNSDNQHIQKFLSSSKLKHNAVTFGLGQGADISASQIQISDKNGLYGINFKIQHKGNVVPALLPDALGRSNIYSALAAAAVGVGMGMNLVEVSQALMKYVPPPGRLRVLGGIKHTKILDDTYNAAPASTVLALEVLSQIAAGGKWRLWAGWLSWARRPMLGTGKSLKKFKKSALSP
jgi:UDP-N-acetylmuramoyl-tripeptide--D-alanyl-D-alanine ligase